MRSPGRNWIIVLGCVAIACLPARLREGLRGKLLEITVRTTSRGDPRPEAPTAREHELENRLALLDAELKGRERELEDLRAANETVAGRTDLRLVPAEAFPLAGPGELVRRLVLGRGERDGITEKAPVLAGAALVGFVVQATRDRSEVRLVTDPSFKLRVTAPRAGVEGILAGTGGPTLVFSPAPQGDDDPGHALKPGDSLVVSRASTLCTVPAVLGTIRDVERAAGEACSRARVVPAAPLALLARVVVVRQEDELARRLEGPP